MIKTDPLLKGFPGSENSGFDILILNSYRHTGRKLLKSSREFLFLSLHTYTLISKIDLCG